MGRGKREVEKGKRKGEEGKGRGGFVCRLTNRGFLITRRDSN